MVVVRNNQGDCWAAHGAAGFLRGAGWLQRGAAGCYDTVCCGNVCAERSQNHLYKRSIPGLGGGRFICSVYVKLRSCRERMCVGTLSSSLRWGPLSGGRYPYVHGWEGTARIRDPANPRVQTGAGSHVPPSKPTPGTRLKTQPKGELGTSELGAAFESCFVPGRSCVTLQRPRSAGERCAGGSSASRELKQPDPRARSESSRPGTRGRPGSLCLLVHQPASPEPTEAPQALAPFHAGNVTFPLERGRALQSSGSVSSVPDPNCCSSR